MLVKRIQGVFSWFVVLSELSHVFCCVLPSVFAILTMFATMGIMTFMPDWLKHIHDAVHVWEVPIILMSSAVLVISWGLHLISKRFDCHDTGCEHGPCTPKKDKNARILIIATCLFIVNISIYAYFHVKHHPDHAGHHPETGVVIESHAHHGHIEEDHTH